MRAARTDLRRYFAWLLVLALVLQAQLGAVLGARGAPPPELCAAHDTTPVRDDPAPAPTHEHCTLCQLAAAPALPMPAAGPGKPAARLASLLPPRAAAAAPSALPAAYRSRAPPATV